MTTRTAKQKTPTKKKPVKKAPTKKPTTASADAKVAELMRDLLPKLDRDMFEDMCEDGQTAILQLSKLLNVDHSSFAAPRNVQIFFENVDMELPASHRHSVGTHDFTATISITHVPSGSTYENEIDIADVYDN